MTAATNPEDAPENERSRILKYAAVGAIAIVLALASILIVPHTSNQLQQCQDIILQSQRDSCLSQLAVSNSNSTICSYIHCRANPTTATAP